MASPLPPQGPGPASSANQPKTLLHRLQHLYSDSLLRARTITRVVRPARASSASQLPQQLERLRVSSGTQAVPQVYLAVLSPLQERPVCLVSRLLVLQPRARPVSSGITVQLRHRQLPRARSGVTIVRQLQMGEHSEVLLPSEALNPKTQARRASSVSPTLPGKRVLQVCSGNLHSSQPLGHQCSALVLEICSGLNLLRK